MTVYLLKLFLLIAMTLESTSLAYAIIQGNTTWMIKNLLRFLIPVWQLITLNKKNDTFLLSTHMEFEKSDISIEKLARFNCNNIPYFKLCDVRDHLMAPTTDTIANYISYLKDENIWLKLFD
jgi:hypothetical protein